MADRFCVFIAGEPVQQGSKTVMNGALVENNRGKLKSWRAQAVDNIRAAAAEADFPHGWDALVMVQATYWYTRPASHFGTGRNAGVLRATAPVHKVSTPDLDKLDRAVLDALTQSGVIRDDARVAVLEVQKMWADPCRGPGVELEVSTGASILAPLRQAAEASLAADQAWYSDLECCTEVAEVDREFIARTTPAVVLALIDLTYGLLQVNRAQGRVISGVQAAQVTD